MSWCAADWEDACSALAEVLPGSFAAFVSHDLRRSVINGGAQYGLDQPFVESYFEHYGALNPWVNFWSRGRSGEVGVAERDCPSSSFARTEYYADWLRPIGNADAGAGVRIDVDPANTINFAWHYSVRQAEQYDSVAARVLNAVTPHAVEAVRRSELLNRTLEASRSLGDLVERFEGWAFMLERDCKIVELNQVADRALAERSVVIASAGTLLFRDAAAQRWLEKSTARILDAYFASDIVATFTVENLIFRATLTKPPLYIDKSPARLIAKKPRVLLTVEVLVGAPIHLSTTDLSEVFSLSPAEINLCEMLVNGLSLTEAAERSRLTEGTLRQRIKAVFGKTRTHRQGELVALLARFRSRN